MTLGKNDFGCLCCIWVFQGVMSDTLLFYVVISLIFVWRSQCYQYHIIFYSMSYLSLLYWSVGSPNSFSLSEYPYVEIHGPVFLFFAALSQQYFTDQGFQTHMAYSKFYIAEETYLSLYTYMFEITTDLYIPFVSIIYL